ncbi:fluoride efflux transporter CrcB [Anaerocolumna sedimenticola]|uniref:Fluoride-specific ion channel FluC n=1 Tax=Anaerocolumna sedimenticola TaxID=2696063 RepID=A0A6P1THR3_9FIRM|nr:fluoride efflux transporter CrcB [Anaerocolumna sedimenticola]QHQ59476.1 fluoride efflux transporter CrcB [Anaerocolumna sedimenticola]
MDLIFVGIGGALGSLTRYQAGKMISRKSGISFPIGTFLINITGAILLGIVSSLDTGKNVYLLFGDGFLGAYTTFSTFMYEGFQLFQDNKKLNALIYILSSLVLGILGYTLAYYLI